MLGDSVNLSARLMANAQANSVLVDSSIANRPQEEVEFETLTPIKVKGKEALIQIFRPSKVQTSYESGLMNDKQIKLPWAPCSTLFGGQSPLTELKDYEWLEVVNAYLDVEPKAALPANTTRGQRNSRSIRLCQSRREKQRNHLILAKIMYTTIFCVVSETV